jgi:hypothetical protein
MRAGPLIIGVAAGVLVTPAAVVLAVLSAGAGHGHYEAARALFPYTMLLTLLSGDTITLPLIALALVQFPLYGLALGLAAGKGRLAWALLLLSAAHAVAALACFSGAVPNFS